MESLIQIFRMNEIDSKTRIKILKQLGHAINFQHGMNITEPLVYELVIALDPNNQILNDKHYTQYINREQDTEQK